jgi:hypothetical protein
MGDRSLGMAFLAGGNANSDAGAAGGTRGGGAIAMIRRLGAANALPSRIGQEGISIFSLPPRRSPLLFVVHRSVFDLRALRVHSAYRERATLAVGRNYNPAAESDLAILLVG